MNWINETLYWYIYLFILGIIFVPISRRLFPRFLDSGYAFSKTLALISVTYLAFLLGTLKILPFTQFSLFFLIIFLAIINLAVSYRTLQDIYTYFFGVKISTKSKKKQLARVFPIKFSMAKFTLFAFEEFLFLLGLFFLAYIRGQEPSIHGLEKFMDFGFMNSILRSNYFPPLDMWLSADPTKPQGYPINYYYFGHLSGALLIKLTGISPYVGYNLVLATILGQGAVLVFSLVSTICYTYQAIVKKFRPNYLFIIAAGVIGSFIVNLGGNLHTIYLFTTGYNPDTPVPFWQIFSTFNPTKYWYPNATRFIPFTIHEFPSYSYVVADLHGHVFDIPFVLVTLAILFQIFISTFISREENPHKKNFSLTLSRIEEIISPSTIVETIRRSPFLVVNGLLLGFMAAIHYMTNAFDGPIYILLALIIFTFLYSFTAELLISAVVMVISFVIFAFPFSYHFSPFVSGIGVNCSPSFLVEQQKIGPFLFEKGNCQISPLWMLFVLWGFFFVCMILLITTILLEAKEHTKVHSLFQAFVYKLSKNQTDIFALILFIFGFFLITIPEFFYIKDIYPQHFRANTMFKLGYQAFIMMGISSGYVLFRMQFINSIWRYAVKIAFVGVFFLIFLYPFFSFPSYYGDLKKTPQLDGSRWLIDAHPADKEIIDYLNSHVKGQPVVLEAQGDSYTDFERISANTGMPTVGGWLVHEWLWRGSADVVGKRIPDISSIYETSEPQLASSLLQKYHVKYVVVSQLERDKYPLLNEKKFEQIGKKVFESSDRSGALYQLN